MELFRQLVHGQTDKQTDGLTELVPKSLLQLKRCGYDHIDYTFVDMLKRDEDMFIHIHISL